MSTKRLALALDELAQALFEILDSGAGEASSSASPQAASFSQAQPVETRDAGNCPIHGYPFKTTKKDGTPTRPYCSTKMPDGTWCKERPA